MNAARQAMMAEKVKEARQLVADMRGMRARGEIRFDPNAPSMEDILRSLDEGFDRAFERKLPPK